MKKIGITFTNLFISIAYIIIVGLFVGLVIYSALNFKNDVYSARGDSTPEVFTNYEHEWIEDSSMPCGGMDVVYIKLDSIDRGVNNLAFFTIHQNVRVYIGDELVYSEKPSEANAFGKTSGDLLINIPLVESDEGKLLRIEFCPVYEDLVGYIPDIYLGDELALFKHLAKKDFLALIFAVISLVLGIVFISWFFFNKKYNPKDNSILYIGCFSICIGFWKITDLQCVDAFFDHSIAVAQVPLISLFLVVVPVLCFLRDFFKQEYKNLYNTVIMLFLLVDFIIYLLQIFKISDFRESLFVAHIMFVILMIIGGTHIFLSIYRGGWNVGLLVAVVCLLICMLGIVVDLVIYYNYTGGVTSAYGMIGFISYVVAMGVFKIRESAILMEKGLLAKHYEDIAYHDQMTGVYSRAAYIEYIDKDNFTVKDSSVIMLDLNNLKKCNDTLGHDAGDIYILDSVKIINEAFSDYGNIFRLGGDEFCVIMNGISDIKIYSAIRKLRKKEESYNANQNCQYPIKIALGYTQFDKNEDHDFNDTIRRADKLMYANKLELKNKERLQ